MNREFPKGFGENKNTPTSVNEPADLKGKKKTSKKSSKTETKLPF
jgi:hypothetical protein